MTGATAFDLGALLERERVAADRALERALARWDRLLPDDVRAAARHGVLSGGKRLRPILCVTAYRAVALQATDDHDAVHDLGAALELIHAYSLMHDDLPCMDDAPLRRGRPTTHRVHGDVAATIAGAALVPLAVAQALEAARALGCDETRARAVAADLADAAGAGGMVGGQALDLLGEGRRLSPGELERLHGLKTGALLVASLTIGGRAAGAAPSVLQGLAEYGRRTGLAFQITDDVLDATASAEELGKEPSDDALDKSTYVGLFGLEGARARAEVEVREAGTALSAAGVDAPALQALARYVVDRAR